MQPLDRTVDSLWQDYLFLTQEMLKFISRRDMDMFYALLEQRDSLQRLLDDTDDTEYRQSPVGKALLNKAVTFNQEVNNWLKLVYNQTCRQQEINQSYDGHPGNTGIRIDFQR